MEIRETPPPTKEDGTAPAPDVSAPLLAAVRNNDFASAERLLAQPMAAEILSPTLVILAANSSPAAIRLAELICSKGADVGFRPENGATALMVAAGKANAAMAKWLIGRGADVAARDGRMRTAVFYAAEAQGDGSEVIALLVEAGANPNDRDQDRNSPMHLACERAVLGTVHKLIELDSDVNASNSSAGDTPLHILARKKGADSVKCAQELISAGADLSAVNKQGRTPAKEATSNEPMRLLLDPPAKSLSSLYQDGMTSTEPAPPAQSKSTPQLPIYPEQPFSSDGRPVPSTMMPPPQGSYYYPQPQPELAPRGYYGPPGYYPRPYPAAGGYGMVPAEGYPAGMYPPQLPNAMPATRPDLAPSPVTMMYENGVHVLQIDISTKANQESLIIRAKNEKMQEELLSQLSKIDEEIKAKVAEINTTAEKAGHKLGLRRNRCNEYMQKRYQAETTADTLAQEIERANRFNESMRREFDGSDPNHEEEKKRDPDWEVDFAGLRFTVGLLDEDLVVRQLNDEINEFHKWVLMQAKQLKPIKQKLVEELTQTVRGMSPDLDINIYGSYAAELCLPSSDIDLVVVSKNGGDKDPLALLEQIKAVLDRKSWPIAVNIIKGASTPVIKVECGEEQKHTKIDITVKDSRHKGLECVKIVRDYIKHYGMLERLLLVFKYIFKLGGLNDPYLGGLSSYGLLLLIVAFLQEHSAEAKTSNVGQLLLLLMRFYADFDFSNTTIRPRLINKLPGATQPIFSKRTTAENVPTVIDPLLSNPPNNVAKCTHKMEEIRDMLTVAIHYLFLDCGCGLHKRNACMLHPYTKGMVNFADSEHSLLCKMFAAAQSFRQLQNVLMTS